MNWEEIITLLEQGEGQSVEFEKQTPPPEDLLRDIVAFANSDGGKIILGLDDKNKHLVGLEISGDEFKTCLRDLVEKKSSPKINYELDIIEKGTKQVAIINVSEGDEKPYKTDDICYIRDGGVSRPAKEDEEKQITNPWGGQGLNKRQLRSLQLIQERGRITNRSYRTYYAC